MFIKTSTHLSNEQVVWKEILILNYVFLCPIFHETEDIFHSMNNSSWKFF